MKKAKKLMAKLMVLALVLAYIPAPAANVSAASNKVSTKMYTLSQKAGTYTAAFKLTIKAKKGYKIYYSTGSNLNIKKVIKSGKKKTIKISKTTTLKIYAVKKSTTITKKKLKTSAVKKKTKSYKYVIDTTGSTTSESTTTTDTTSSNSTTATTAATTAAPADTGSDTKPTEKPSTGDGSAESGSSGSGSSDSGSSDSDSSDTGSSDTGSSEADSSEESSTVSTEKESVVISDEEKEVTFSVSSSDDENAGITTTKTDDGTEVTVSAAGTYTLSGYSNDLHINVNVSDASSEDPVVLDLDALTVDNSSETSDSPVINISKDTAAVKINISGESKIIGASAFSDEPAALISASASTVILSGDDDAVLNLVDGMATDTTYTHTKEDGTTEEMDPADGITAGKGELIIESGTYNIYSNGDCLKGTGNNGEGGVTINGGTLNLVSYLSSAIKSKKGNVTITDGDININSTADNAIQASNYSVNITGGTTSIANCGKNAVKAGGDINISGGTITVTDCAKKAVCSDSNVVISGGKITVNGCTTAIKAADDDASTAGNITISGGDINISNTSKDAVNTDYDITIKGDTTKVIIDKCYGDGIQGENIDIQSGTVNVKTYYEYAATNFYSSNWSGLTNSITESGSSKTETVNYDTGSHKALKAGTKAETYKYTTISADSEETDADGNPLVAGTTYTQTASGGLTISGGTITLDTTNTGIKYNGGSSSSSGNMGGMMGGAPGDDSQSIIGSPDDAIHSNNTASISGGTITINSSDDGITVADTLDITGTANINIATAYEGIEGGTITIGTDDSASQPTVKVYSNDDGINASNKTSTSYVYDDESEETYTKTTVSGSNNTLTVYGGTVTVEIADDTTHSVTLTGTAKDGTGTQTYTFSADGDGIDCNGSFYAYGGTIITIGGTSNGNGVFDRDGAFVIGDGVTIFGIGTNGMVEGPTEVNQPYIQYGAGSSGGMGGMGGNRPGSQGNSGSSSITSGSTITINDSTGNTLYTYTAKKAASYILYSSPSLVSGSSYTINSGTTTLSTVTASTTASSSGGGSNAPTPPGQ